MEQIEYICLGSSSRGNAYIFKKGNECVLVECGFEWKTLLRKLTDNGIMLSMIKSVIITHEHKDHSQSIDKFIHLSIPCFVPKYPSVEQLASVYKNIHFLDNEKKEQLTDWLAVLPFPTDHDVLSFGFMFLDTENNQSILFINDTRYFDFSKYSSIKFNVIFIECNHLEYQLKKITQSCLDNGKSALKYERQARTHLSLRTCKMMLNSINLKSTSAIFLMHLSPECSQPDIMKTEIENVYKIKTFVCNMNGGIN